MSKLKSPVGLPTPTSRLTKTQWQQINATLQQRGLALEQALPCNHAGTRFMPRQKLECSTCKTAIDRSRYTTTFETTKEQGAPLIVFAAADCPGCEGVSLYRFVVPAGDDEPDRIDIPKWLNLVALSRDLSEDRGEDCFARTRSLPYRLRRQVRNKPVDTLARSGLVLIGLGLMGAPLLAALIGAAGYEVFQIWLSSSENLHEPRTPTPAPDDQQA